MRVACICGQRGAAINLVSVVKTGVELYAWDMSILLYGEAEEAFTAESLPYEICSTDFTAADAVAWLKIHNPDIVILGTDEARHVEKRFVRACNGLEKPTISYVDFWANYRARFSDESGLIVPDAVAVVDEIMAQEISRTGIPSRKIKITGSPHFDEILRNGARYSDEQIKAIRERLGIPLNAFVIVFASSPTSSDDYRRDKNDQVNKHSLLPVITDLISCLSVLQQSRERRPLCLIIRPHPRESIHSFDGLDSGRIQLETDMTLKPLEVFALSNMLIGLDTMLLVEAVIAGRQALCIGYVRELNRQIRDIAKGLDIIAESKGDLCKRIAVCLESSSHKSLQKVAGCSDAAGKIISLANSFCEIND